MLKRRILILTILSVATLGLIYWPIPYSEIDLLDTRFVFKWTMSAFLLALVVKPLLRLKINTTVLYITLGYVGSVLIRAFYEDLMDTAAHTLLLFEILFAIFNTAPPAVLGSFVGQYVQHKVFGDEDE